MLKGVLFIEKEIVIDLKELDEIDLPGIFGVFFKYNGQVIGFKFFVLFLIVGKVFGWMGLFEFHEEFKEEPEVDVEEFELVLLETKGGVVVLAGVMEEELFDSPVEGFGFCQEFLFSLEGILQLGVLF